MSILRPAVLVVAFASTALSCGAPTGPSHALVGSVVAAERSATDIVHLDVDWRNQGAVPVYLSACGGHVSMSLERRAAGTWQGFGGGICLANLDQNPVRLDAGQYVRATVGVGPGDGGEYRAVTSVAADLGPGSALVRSPSAYVR
jgi:hypothetical protein